MIPGHRTGIATPDDRVPGGNFRHWAELRWAVDCCVGELGFINGLLWDVGVGFGYFG